MTTLTLSPGGQLTLPPDVLQQTTWKHADKLVMLCLGDVLVLRPALSSKTADISDLAGFFKRQSLPLTTEELCQPVELTEEPAL